MQLTEKYVAQLDLVTLVTTLRDTLGSEKVIRALYKTSHDEWNNSFDQNTGEHLIKGVFTSGQKSDAVKTYISKLMAQFMRSLGVRSTAWTKNTIASENFTNVSISNKIAGTQFAEHGELFKIVVTRLMGFDDGLVEFALENEPSKKAKLLAAYLGARFDLVSETDDVTKLYPSLIDIFTEKFSEDVGLFTQQYLHRLAVRSAFYYTSGKPFENPFDALTNLIVNMSDTIMPSDGFIWGDSEEGADEQLNTHATSEEKIPTGEDEEQ